MSKLVITIVASLLAGIAIAAMVIKSPEPTRPASTAVDSDAGLSDRISALEYAIGAEREARQLLEDEILALYQEIEMLESRPLAGSVNSAPDRPQEVAMDRREMRAAMRSNQQRSEERRREALMEAGFSPDRAEWILIREGELRMEAMQARYEAMRAGEPANNVFDFTNPELKLRDELGDTQYESYLEASGRATAVDIRRVFESSPAQTAGLQPGDQITHYDGRRIFNTFDLTQQTMEGTAGESVVVNITRDGMPMQLVLPRGPLGVNTSGRR